MLTWKDLGLLTHYEIDPGLPKEERLARSTSVSLKDDCMFCQKQRESCSCGIYSN